MVHPEAKSTRRHCFEKGLNDPKQLLATEERMAASRNNRQQLFRQHPGGVEKEQLKVRLSRDNEELQEKDVKMQVRRRRSIRWSEVFLMN